MLIVMNHNATAEDVDRVVSVIRSMGYDARPIPGSQRVAIGVVGNDGRIDSTRLETLPGVQEVHHITRPYKQVSREWKEEPTLIPLSGGRVVGGARVIVMAGPCAVESREQVLAVADIVKESGAAVLRGGAVKPRTSPYAFQGLGEEGFRLLAEARERTGLPVVSEVLDAESLAMALEYVDILQVGARNMQNFSLLRQVGKAPKPVLLKRGMSATIDELLLAAEYIVMEGNQQVILCERGIKSFDDHTRNLLDLTAIPVLKGLTHLPVIADPSHGTGRREKIIPMARAAVAAGADGVMVEVHPQPEMALCDGLQSLYPDQFRQLMTDLRAIARAVGREL